MLRFDAQPAYVLHASPYRETSLLLETFTRDHGRVGLIARGVRGVRGQPQRAVLQPLQPLLLGAMGQGELLRLTQSEAAGPPSPLQGEATLAAFYLNELLLRLLPREDGHESLFDYYAQTLRTLSRSTEYASTLRRFELKMLQEMGYAVPLEQDQHQSQIVADAIYTYIPELGAVARAQAKNFTQSGVQLSGKTLLDMSNGDYADVQTQQQSKQLMRSLLAHYLGDKPLHTRQLLIDLQGL